ncbi:MAG: phage tail protein [Ilumatobacteraceae bacterium]
MPNDSFDGERVTAATFLFEVDGVEIGRFMGVSGLEVTVAVEEIEEGGENSYVHKLPGRMTWPNITLKRGITQNDTLLAWLNKSSGEQFSANGNKLARSTAAITLMGPAGARLRSWEFDGAFPIKWKGPDFDVASTDMALEELEITHHGFRAKSVS